jgi:hypothetical protein
VVSQLPTVEMNRHLCQLDVKLISLHEKAHYNLDPISSKTNKVRMVPLLDRFVFNQWNDDELDSGHLQ